MSEDAGRPIIIKKPIVYAHAGHHGGAWKVAYADFVTAMTAFFLLIWLLGATTEKQRKALADYFAPTIVQKKDVNAGADGLLGGDVIIAQDQYPNRTGMTGEKSIMIPKANTGGDRDNAERAADRARFAQVQQLLRNRLARDKDLSRFARGVRFTETTDGLRVDLVDDANFTMFLIGTNVLTPEAPRLLPMVAEAISGMPTTFACGDIPTRRNSPPALATKARERMPRGST